MCLFVFIIWFSSCVRAFLVVPAAVLSPFSRKSNSLRENEKECLIFTSWHWQHASKRDFISGRIVLDQWIYMFFLFFRKSSLICTLCFKVESWSISFLKTFFLLSGFDVMLWVQNSASHVTSNDYTELKTAPRQEQHKKRFCPKAVKSSGECQDNQTSMWLCTFKRHLWSKSTIFLHVILSLSIQKQTRWTHAGSPQQCCTIVTLTGVADTPDQCFCYPSSSIS